MVNFPHIGIMKNIKQNIKIYSKGLHLGLLILTIIWLILYALPNFIANLFDTILGKIILFLLVVSISLQNTTYGILLTIILIVLFRFRNISVVMNHKEGFTWKKGLINKFLEIQNTQNPDIVFDTQQIQKQASEEELQYFIKNKRWPWSKNTENLYTYYLNKNPYIRTDPSDAINTLRTIYNEQAILQIMSAQEKEGQFLLNGVTNSNSNIADEELPDGSGTYPYSTKQITKKTPLYKCGYAKTGEPVIFETQYKKDNGITGAHVTTHTPLDYNKLEAIIPGFKFINKPCNPCQALNDPPDYNCPFSIDISNKIGGISPIWKYLWGLQ